MLEEVQVSVPKRRTWDPKKSDLVDQILSDLIKRYKNGELKGEINPQILRSLSTDHAAFYHAAFHRLSRPEWAMQRYPNEFADFVQELNEALRNSGIKIKNSKKEIGLYGKLPASEIEIIKVYQDLCREGTVSKDQAIAELREHHNIVLSKSRCTYYFSRIEVPQVLEASDEIKIKKAQLIKRIEAIKEAVGLDLSIKQCVKGLLFESFVGAYLSFRFGREHLYSQKHLPIAYRDLTGTPHRNVYIDFLVKEGDSESIYEVKLGNSLEGILNSSLPQLAAYESHTGKRSVNTVLYLNPCPLMRFALDAEIRVKEELLPRYGSTFIYQCRYTSAFPPFLQI